MLAVTATSYDISLDPSEDQYSTMKHLVSTILTSVKFAIMN